MTNDSSKPSIPEWQRSSTPTESPADSPEQPDPDRSALLRQAETFLSDPAIRDATTSRKISFLESKGLTNDEIDSLLGVSRNEEASDDTSSEAKTAHVETSTSSATAVSTTAPSTSTPPPSRDVPPIITYPEFLVNASAPHNPPLLSLRSVLYTLYGAAGLGATVYGASEYLIKPMLNTLSDARHELAETALTNLSTLNEKLEQNVSKIPIHIPASERLEDEETEETESITSDPTEVFHRDIATQTSPDLFTSNIALPTVPSEENAENDSHKAIDSHTRSLTQITSHLREFISNHTTSAEIDSSMRDQVSSLQTYLDGLIYSYNSYLASNTMYNSIYSSDQSRSKEGDAVSTFRAEIRGVKGALLSARNFPSGRPAGVAR
jgi:Pex14 N-terminal domain